MARFAWWLGLAACGSGSAQPDASQSHDAPVLVEGPNPITIHLAAPTNYIRYRNGTSGWGQPERISPLEYRVHVDDAYEVLVACQSEHRAILYADSELHGRSVADGDDYFAGCFELAAPPPSTTVFVSGRMAQAGTVTLGGDLAWTASQPAPWQFRLHMTPGKYDLIAQDRDRIAIRRSLKALSSTTVETIDLDREGVAFESVPFTVPGLTTTEKLLGSISVRTPGGSADIVGTADVLHVVPAALVQPTDEQLVSIAAYTANTSRTFRAPLDGTQTFQLMPLLGEHSFTFSVPNNRSLRAEWTNLPTFDGLHLFIASNTHSYRVNVTKHFLDASHRMYVAVEEPLDFDDDWRVSLRSDYYRDIGVIRTTGDESYDTSRQDIVTNVTGN